MAEEFVRVRCTSCSALVRIPRVTGSHPCSECGAMLAVKLKESPQEPPPPEPERPVKESTAERIEASRAVTRAATRLKALRWLYAVGSVFSLIMVLVELYGLSRHEVETLAAAILLCIFTGSLVVHVCAFLMLLQQPVLWSMSVAVTSSLVVLLWVSALFIGESTTLLLVVLGIQAVWVLLMWWVVSWAFRLRRLAREVPDSYAVQSLLDAPRLRRPATVSPEEWDRRLQAANESARARARLRAGGISIVVVLLVAAASVAIYVKVRPPSFERSVARFVDAWALQDAALIGTMATPQHRAAIERRLTNAPETRQWTAGWPELVEKDRVVGDGFAKILYREEAECMRVDWALENKRWQVTGVDLPWPAIDETLEHFVDAWTKSDVKYIGALFPPESREKLEASLQRHVERHGWKKDFPTLEFSHERAISESRVGITFLYDGGAIEVTWRLDPDDRWVLTGIKWPRE